MTITPNILRYALGALIGALLAFAVCRSCEPDTVIRERFTHIRKVDTAWLPMSPQVAVRPARVRKQTSDDSSVFGTASVDTVSGPFVAIDTAAFGRDTAITSFAWPQALFTHELRRYTPIVTVTDSTVTERSEDRNRRTPIGLGFHVGYGFGRDGRADWVVSVGLNVSLIQLGL